MTLSPFSFRQQWDDRIEMGAAQVPSGVYRFAPVLPKPCIHPLTTALGHTLTGFEMSDHVWHRGLWFTVKFVNDSNFWEEKSPFGIQVSKAQPRCALTSANTLRIEHSLNWTAEATGTALNENRTITFHADSSGIGTIDWSSHLHAMQDLLLDRTPYTTWGGYGGLAFRGSRELHKAGYVVPSGEIRPELIGERHDWTIMQALVDGGVDQRVSLGIIDHPGNPRGQTPWYCRGHDGYILMNAAFLFHEPMTVKQGETLHFRYRIIYRDGTWSPDDFAKLAKIFREDYF